MTVIAIKVLWMLHKINTKNRDCDTFGIHRDIFSTASCCCISMIWSVHAK